MKIMKSFPIYQILFLILLFLRQSVRQADKRPETLSDPRPESARDKIYNKIKARQKIDIIRLGEERVLSKARGAEEGEMLGKVNIVEEGLMDWRKTFQMHRRGKELSSMLLS
jgi:hypothetical protein